MDWKRGEVASEANRLLRTPPRVELREAPPLGPAGRGARSVMVMEPNPN